MIEQTAEDCNKFEHGLIASRWINKLTKDKDTPEMRAYYAKIYQLNARGCVILVCRAVITRKLLSRYHTLIHKQHFDVHKLLDLVNDLVLWPFIVSDIRELIQKCPSCNVIKNKPEKNFFVTIT